MLDLWMIWSFVGFFAFLLVITVVLCHRQYRRKLDKLASQYLQLQHQYDQMHAEISTAQKSLVKMGQSFWSHSKESERKLGQLSRQKDLEQLPLAEKIERLSQKGLSCDAIKEALLLTDQEYELAAKIQG